MQKKKLINIISVMLAIFFLSACEYATITPDLPPADQKVSFANDIQPIFNKSCNSIGCHNSTGPKPDLTAGKSFNSLMDNEMVVPFKSAESVLYTTLTTGVMKTYGNANSNALIKNWIDQGAENN